MKAYLALIVLFVLSMGVIVYIWVCRSPEEADARPVSEAGRMVSADASDTSIRPVVPADSCSTSGVAISRPASNAAVCPVASVPAVQVVDVPQSPEPYAAYPLQMDVDDFALSGELKTEKGETVTVPAGVFTRQGTADIFSAEVLRKNLAAAYTTFQILPESRRDAFSLKGELKQLRFVSFRNGNIQGIELQLDIETDLGYLEPEAASSCTSKYKNTYTGAFRPVRFVNLKTIDSDMFAALLNDAYTKIADDLKRVCSPGAGQKVVPPLRARQIAFLFPGEISPAGVQLRFNGSDALGSGADLYRIFPGKYTIDVVQNGKTLSSEVFHLTSEKSVNLMTK